MSFINNLRVLPTNELASVPDDKPKHDRRMAALGEGGRLKVEIASIPSLQKTAKGKPFIVLDTKLLADRSRKEVSIWDTPAEDFARTTSYMRISGQNPLVVQFDGRYRRKDTFSGERNMRSEFWIFNAKSFDIDWTSPAAKMAHPGTLRMTVETAERREQKSTGTSFWAITGIDENRRRCIRLDGQHAGATASKLLHATPQNPIQFEFSGNYQMRHLDGKMLMTFTAKGGEALIRERTQSIPHEIQTQIHHQAIRQLPARQLPQITQQTTQSTKRGIESPTI